MPRIEESVNVKAPIEVVFAAVTDPQRSIEWSPNIVAVSDISPYPVQIGTSWRQTARTVGQTADFTCTITALEPPSGGVLQVSGDYDARVTTRCRVLDGETQVSQVIEFDAESGLKGSMIATVMQAVVRRELTQSLTRMRDTLEAETRGDHGPRPA